MVRETRHLWVGNLPDNIREDRIREHFKRYGRVQNVKLLGRMESASANSSGGANSGVCATVAFMDIKSASKAHNVEHVLDERTLTTEYYEPAAIPSSAGAPSAGSSPAGSGYSGSSSSVNSAPAPVSTSRYHLSGEESAGNACAMAASAAAPATWRGTNDSATEYCRRGNTPAAYGRYQRNNSTAPYATPPSNTERTPGHARWYAGVAGAAGAAGGAGGESAPSTPGGGGGERRRRASGSGSSRSRSDSSSPEPSDTSRASTPHAPPPPHARPTPPSHTHQWPSTANGRPLAICVRNLPTRSTDSSLKDGLYHEYKKHGKVVWVKVVGQNADRYAVVRFKKPSDVDKALEVSQDKLFFGCKISVAPHQNCDDDAESAKPYETDIDEYHPKATRTLFIGNLEKDVTQQQLREKFKHFGRIIEIDIKKGSGGGAGYAFCQYASISSVVEAIRAMDGEYVGSSRVKLGFGKPVATTCVWVDGLTEHTEKQVLGAVSRCGAATSVCVDRAAGAALVHFEQAAAAGGAVRELRRVAAMLSAAEPDHPRLCVDYASRECQEAFYEQLEKHGGSSALAGGDRMASELSGRYLPTPRHDTLRYDTTGTRSRAPSFGRSTSRTPRFTHDVYDPAEYAADRRYRVYDELGSSPQTDEANYEDRLQSVVVSPHRGHKHRRDSSPEERKLSKERHRSAGAGSRRSRSGSRGEKHVSRRRHRRRRDGSESRGSRASRAGTPLRDEVDVAGAPPTEPRRPPRERPPLPMSLPLPKFAVQLLRAAPSVPRVVPPPAPASPPRPPSASSSSGGSAPHSPSLEERIRSLDEKYERWTGSRAHMDAPDRARLRHRLLELDINEVKPSEVVRSLLAKRSVFDEDSERLEVATRAPSPSGSPRSLTSAVPRTLRYPFPSHATQVPLPVHTPPLPDSDELERTIDPRLNRPSPVEKTKYLDSDNIFESRLRLRTPSTDKTLHESIDRKTSPTIKDSPELAKEERKRRNSMLLPSDEFKTNLPVEKLHEEKSLSDKQFENSVLMELQEKCYSSDSFPCSEEKSSSEKSDSRTEEITVVNPNNCVVSSIEMHASPEEEKAKIQDIKLQPVKEDASTNLKISADKFLSKNDLKNNAKSETKLDDMKPKLETEHKSNDIISWKRKESDRCKDKNSISNFHKDTHPTNFFNSLNSIELPKCTTDSKGIDCVNKDKCEVNKTSNLNNEVGESHTFEINKSFDKVKQCNVFFPFDKRLSDIDKNVDDILKADRERHKSSKDKPEKESDKEKGRNKTIKVEKNEKDKKTKDEPVTNRNNGDKMAKIKSEKIDTEDDKIIDKEREFKLEEKSARHENHKKDKSEKERKKELDLDISQCKIKKEERYKHERAKRESSDSKRDSKKDIDTKTRKSSRDESSRDISRKDSTDSSTSRASHDSTKSKESESDAKEETKTKVKLEIVKLENEKNFKLFDSKIENKVKVKNEIKEEKETRDNSSKIKIDNSHEHVAKARETDKQRHYSLDSPSTESKRKERLNSCSSLPVSVGNKRRMSSHESIDYNFGDESKKCRSEVKHERRDSKDTRNSERPKSTKFNKGYFAKIIESKTKDDKKNQVKPPDEVFSEIKDVDEKDGSIDTNKIKRNHHEERETLEESKNTTTDNLQNNFDFLATLELRSSEEDERQKALRKEMKEKKRIQQLQQIQELQQQADALQQAEQINKMKDDKKYKTDDKKKEAMREKRMSTDRKSKDEKNDNLRRKSRKPTNSTDTSDSDEPKKHSIFDIIDDEPTYTMYDKVKARSCKNMQKQEEEKRQEKIKAKFSQLKQSRAKREEKKRSSWDEDSDSDHERSKIHKLSMDSSSEDDGSITHNKKREKRLSSSFDYDHSRDNDFFNSTSNDEDVRNKLSRKNSRTRIISDTSDDDNMPTGKTNGPDFINSINKDDSSLLKFTDSDISLKNSCEDKIKKTSLLNLFGKSDSEDNRQKLSLDVHSEFRLSYNKSFSNDFSSESESNPLNRIHSEMRRRHKKKQRKYKFLLSDEDAKHETSNIESNKDIELDIESKYKNSDKSRRHSNKKEKRKERIRDSFDNEEQRDEKVKLLDKKRSPNQPYDLLTEITANSIKKEGRMEDIFGPLSDDSDRDSSMVHVNKTENNLSEFETKVTPNSDKIGVIDCDENRHHKDESNRRKKEKKRRERKHFTTKEDENSLDVDAVSKAIEARLFADTSNTDDNRIKFETLSNDLPKEDQNEFRNNIKAGSEIEMISHKHAERLKKDSRDRKKKKKRNREDKRNRKNHHHFYQHEKTDKIDNIENVELSPKVLLDIPLPTDVQKHDNPEKSDDSKSLSESPSLPRITDSPTFATHLDENSESKTNDDMTPKRLVVDDRIEVDFNVNETIEVDEIPMPPPIENIVQDISEVPLPKDPPINDESCQSTVPNITTDYDINKSEVDSNEDAVRSICNLDDDPEKQKTSSESLVTKQDKKVEEKPRAVISQEETEDAVAALLGESFGGNVNTFPNCYEKVEDNTTHQTEIECTVIENEIIPEEDAEEMRQAVQNLNACEMEMKPDTPVSDSDLLLIDTDTEENEDNTQDAIERLPVNIIATNQSLNNNTKTSIALSSDASNVIVAKPQISGKSIHPVETKVENKTDKDSNLKPQGVKKDGADQATSTATPVITSWTLSNKKLMEPRVINIPAPHVPSGESESKTTHITANIVQIKPPQNQTVKINNVIRPILNQNRLSTPYQVINQVIRPQVSNMQPPTIKIPESHVIYQKPQAIVISPRLTGNDPRLQSPKSSPQADGMTSPRLTNMTIVNTNSPQNINSVVSSPSAVQQRSPGQVTVVRMQQPPLSPIHTMHLPPGARAMVSPNRPNSVLVQTQGAPIHLNRIPVTPVLAPITKHLGNNNLIQTVPKSGGVNSSPIIHQQKVITGECRKPEGIADNAKIILSPTRLQHNTTTNPTILAQNRLISMQNALNVSNPNSTLHLTNKVLLNNKNLLNEKRETQFYKSDHSNLPSFVPNSILQVANVSHSNTSIIQGGTKPVMCNTQDPGQLSRGQVSNVIHSINSQRLVTSSPISNVLQLDSNKGPSVLSIAPVRSTSILTKSECNTPVITTSSLTNVVMTPLLLKTTTSPKATIRLHPRSEGEIIENKVSVTMQCSQNDSGIRLEQKNILTNVEIKNTIKKSPEHISPTKCETDFEELLKDNTNEIKVTNDPNKKLEINVGKSLTTISQNIPKKIDDKSIEEKQLVALQESDEKFTVIKGENLQKELKKSDDTLIHDTAKETKSKDLLPQKVEDSKELSGHSVVNTQVTVNPNLTKKEDDNKSENHITESAGKETEGKKVENYFWSANDVNIESVIKKVDSLCNDIHEDKKLEIKIASEESKDVKITNDTKVIVVEEKCAEEMKEIDKNKEEIEPTKNQEALQNDQNFDDQSNERVITTGKRGGRNSRGKKAEKNQDRVQARKITKPVRGTNSSKRGRGRCKVDKRTKNLVNSNPNNIPGDVYDFHEDSGDETSTSPNKNEARPRLILTIKSPLSGNSGATPTSTLSITPKEQNMKVDKPKEEKSETFASPSTNTRKSRRLQEKDIQRTTVDDVIDDVIKNSTMMCKNNKEPNKKRPTRQVSNKMNTDKSTSNDTRKSPRGTKRPRNRSLSDASMDSNEEAFKKDDMCSEPKIIKVSETIPKITVPEPEHPVAKPTNVAPPVTSCLPVNPTPIMKPPKKMISEISAKLACTFDTSVNVAPKAGDTSPTVPERLGQFIPERLEVEKHNMTRDIRNMDQSNAVEHLPVATGEVIAAGISNDVTLGRRLVDNVPTNMTPVGATEATDARVQSPALPHRPPSTHRATDRATPILIRGGDGDAGSTGLGAGGAGPAASRGFRGAYPGPASLPRGAHHPAHHPAHAPPKPLPPIGAHHPPASRVTLTSVPAISPQGQIPMSTDLVRSPPPAHQQTSPISSGDGMYAHFSHQHYQMYQQHFRATQHENRATPTHFTRTLEAEGSEAPTSPLELRRPPSARVPRPAHSPAPADRHNIMYGVRCGRSPPPAHGTSRPPAALPPAAPGPPHASQVPREADSLQMLLRRYPVMWQGLLALKNDSAAVQMHFVGGNPGVAADALSRNSDGSPASLLRIAQRMRLEPAQLDQVHRKMKLELEHCILLALPCGRDHMDVLQQSTNLSAGFITYLQRKMAAGIVNVAPTPGHQQSMYTVHIFPSCDFANENLTRIAPDLMHRVANIAHLLIVIATAIV